jgi:aminopeptidase N
MLSVNLAYRDRLVEVFSGLDTYSEAGAKALKNGIEARMLKHVLLDLIAVDDSEKSHKIILDHFYSATTSTDRVAALLALNRSSSPLRRKVLDDTYDSWHAHLSGYANYLRVVANGTREDVFNMIEMEKHRPEFDVTQPTWSRALFLPMATNNKMVWTDQGIAWLTDTVIKLAPINATTSGRLLNTFQHVRKLRQPLRAKAREALEKIVKHVSEEACPAVYGQAMAYLK